MTLMRAYLLPPFYTLAHSGLVLQAFLQPAFHNKNPVRVAAMLTAAGLAARGSLLVPGNLAKVGIAVPVLLARCIRTTRTEHFCDIFAQ